MIKKLKNIIILGIKAETLKDYIKFVEKNPDIEELVIEELGAKIKIKREDKKKERDEKFLIEAIQAVSSEGKKSETVVKQQEKEEKSKENETHTYHEIKAPLNGTFYRAPSPESPPFVNEGDIVKKGETLCIVEAMKVMNKISSDIDGKIVKILIENGKPVKKDDVLFYIQPL